MIYDRIKITNHCSFAISVFETFIEDQSFSKENISTNAYDYWPIHQLIQVVDEYGQSFVELEKTVGSRLVITRAQDNFPVALHVLFPNEKEKELQITEDSFNRCKEAWRFYNLLRSQPYSPVCLEYYTTLREITPINLFDIESRIEKVLQEYNYTCGYCEICLVTFWAYTYLYAYEGLYYVYQKTNEGCLMEDEPIGRLKIPQNSALNTALYIPEKERYSRVLFYRYGTLVKEARLQQRGIAPPLGSSKKPARNFKGLTLIFRDLSWENQPRKMAACFMGEINEIEKSIIAQPYLDPNVPWWSIAYDMAYLGFFAAEIGMNLHMAIYVLTGVDGGISFLEKNIQKFLASGAKKLAEQRRSINPSFNLFNPYSENDQNPKTYS